MERNIRSFVAGRDRLFESMLDLALNNETFFCHFMARCGRSPPKPGDSIVLLPMHCEEVLALPVSRQFHKIVLDQLPDKVQLEFFGVPLPVANPIPLGSAPGALNRIQARLISPIFLQFYETYKPWWVSKFNRDPATWPMTLQFSRVIRNAIGHRMKIDWASPNLPPVEWRGLRYSHTDNGKLVIGPDLSLADLIHLMIDLSDELDALGCPIES